MAVKAVKWPVVVSTPWRWHRSAPGRATMVLILLAASLGLTAWLGTASGKDFISRRQEQQRLRWEKKKAGLLKDSSFQNMTTEELQRKMPIWVMSLPRAVDRRTQVDKLMKEAHVKDHQFMDGLDGMNDSAVSAHEVQKFFGGTILSKWEAGKPYYRKKVAADLSHYKLLQKVVDRNAPAIILEDDGSPGRSDDWYSDLLAALKELPNDWDVLYLNGCFVTFGEKVSERLAVLREGYCLIGYIPTPAFARAALAEQEEKKKEFIDVTFRIMFSEQRANAYICNPALVHFFSNAVSLIGSDDPELSKAP